MSYRAARHHPVFGDLGLASGLLSAVTMLDRTLRLTLVALPLVSLAFGCGAPCDQISPGAEWAGTYLVATRTVPSTLVVGGGDAGVPDCR